MSPQQQRRLTLALILVAVSLTACSDDPDAAAWQQAGAPDWLPPFPGTEPFLLSESQPGADVAGILSFPVELEPEAGGKLYENLLSAAGFEVRLFPFDTPGGRTWRLESDHEDGTRGVYLTISPTATGANFVLNYSEARPQAD